jgi:hypothetical protein
VIRRYFVQCRQSGREALGVGVIRSARSSASRMSDGGVANTVVRPRLQSPGVSGACAPCIRHLQSPLSRRSLSGQRNVHSGTGLAPALRPRVGGSCRLRGMARVARSMAPARSQHPARLRRFEIGSPAMARVILRQRSGRTASSRPSRIRQIRNHWRKAAALILCRTDCPSHVPSKAGAIARVEVAMFSGWKAPPRANPIARAIVEIVKDRPSA